MVDVDAQAWNVFEEPPLSTIQSLHSMEGTFRLISSDNFEEFMKSVGVTPLMAAMVMKSDEMVTIYEDLDRQWKIMSETSINGKSLRGYRTRDYKLISNKFLLGKPKPECLEDWDQRLVVSTVTLKDEESKLVIDQKADKDLKFCADSVVTWFGKGDVLTKTIETENGIKATKTFLRHKHQPHEDKLPKRRISVPF